MKQKAYSIDINCDLGEGEPLARTRALMRLVTSANVACGGHAGDVRSMEACVAMARTFKTKLGAHPGLFDRDNFGRKALPISGEELELLLVQQVGGLEKVASLHRVPLHHIKLHGGLYHAVEKNSVLARRYLTVVRRYWPGVKVCALANGTVERVGRGGSVEVRGEAFADRAYAVDGTLVPRGQPGAILTSAAEVMKQVERMIGRSGVNTICIHSDTPNAVRLAKQVVKVAREHD